MLVNKVKAISKLTKIPSFSFTALENQESVENWRQMLNKKATTAEGKAVMGQLNSLIGFYNKEAE